MKKIVIHSPGGYDRLVVEEQDDLHPDAGRVRIDVAAAGINFADCITRMGLYSSARHYVGYPITPGFEVAGIVAEVGEEVDGVTVGDPVFAVTRFHGYAAQVVVPPDQVFPIPEGMTCPEAAGFPAVVLTAWCALFELAHPRPGANILVHSAAGGVGSALVQLARLAGCRVVGVVGAPHKVAAVHALGVDEVIDKSSEDLWATAERLAPDGYDVVLDANGPATLKQSYEHLAAMGKLVVYGFHTMFSRGRGKPNWSKMLVDYGRTPKFDPFKLTTDNRSVMGFNLSYLFEKATFLSEAMDQLLGWYREGKLRLPKTTTYPFEKVADAHRDLESGNTVGKLVLTM